MALPFKVRQSTLETARCLFRLHREHIQGIREPESEVASRGTDFHSLRQTYVNYLVASKQEMDLGYADDLISSSGLNEEAVAIFVDWARNYICPWKNVFATEYRIRLDANFLPCDDADAQYSGDFDELDIAGTEAEIVDAKTHFLAFNPTTIQAVFYPWLLFKVMPHLEKITFTLDFVRYNIKRSREFTREDLFKMDRYVKAQVDRLEEAFSANDWPATINHGCAYCRHACPLVLAGLDRTAIGQVGTAERAREMANELYAMERRQRQILLALRAYAAETGPIVAGNDIQLGFSKRVKFAYEVKDVVALNEEHGFDRNRALSVSAGEIKKIGKRYPEFVARARATAKDKSTTAFQFVNVLGDPIDNDDDDDE